MEISDTVFNPVKALGSGGSSVQSLNVDRVKALENMIGILKGFLVIAKLMVRKRSVGVELCNLELHILIALEGLLVLQVHVDAFRELFNSLLELLFGVPGVASILDFAKLHIDIAKIDLVHVLERLVDSSQRFGCLLV